MAQIDAGLAVVSRYRFLEQGGDPANPAAGYGYLYFKAEGIYIRQDDGTVVGPLGVPYTEGARVYNDANVTISHATDTALPFNSERRDTDNIHDTGLNTSRLTCKTAGVYTITGSIAFVANATSYRQISIDLNGGTRIAGTNWLGNNLVLNIKEITTDYELAVDDYVELIVRQNSGGNLNVNVVGNYSPEFMMQRIG